MTPTQPPPLPPPEPAPRRRSRRLSQQATPAAEPTTDGPVEEHKGGIPPARTGFQIALRTGVAVPLGKIDESGNMSDAFTPQVPIIADIGFKPIPQLFLGGYVGIAAGGVGDSFKKSCDAVGVDCLAVGGRIGIQAQFHILPEARWNPWLGYGLGYAAATRRAAAAAAAGRFGAARPVAPPPPRPAFRVIDMDEAAGAAGGVLRYIDGLSMESVKIGPGAAVPGADGVARRRPR